jgi:tetratricopeptide (TPR) repeat protein
MHLGKILFILDLEECPFTFGGGRMRTQIKTALALTSGMVIGASVGLSQSTSSAQTAHDNDQVIKNVASLNDLCLAHALVGQLEEALIDCNIALQLRPNDLAVLDSRGFVYLKLGQFDNAIADYNAVLKLKPKLAISLYNRGLAKQKKGDSAGGDADIAAAKAIDPKIADKLTGYYYYMK